MKKLRILVLVHEDLVPPGSMEGYPDSEIIEWKTEYDVVTTLREKGHEVRVLGVYDDLGVIRQALEDWKPHIAFNLLEEFHGNPLFDHHIAGYMELMKQRYTGCNPRGLLLAHDKALSKKLMTFHRILTPKFAVFPVGAKLRIPARLDFPLIVKSLYEEGSYGIAHASIVYNIEKFHERVQYLHEKLETPVLVEEYIDGREIYLPLLGNKRCQALPVLEMSFGKMSEDAPRIATSRVKWNWAYQQRYDIDIVLADLDRSLLNRIQRTGRRIYKVLGLNGYARLDMRLTEDGRVYVLEANANPDIGYGEELSVSAESAGMKYDELLQKIIRLGMRYQPGSRRLA